MMFRSASKRSFGRFSKLLPTQSLVLVAGTGAEVFLRKLSVSPTTPLPRSTSSSRRSFTGPDRTDSELFNYTSGRWVFNEALRLQERRLVFDVDEFMRLAAESVGRRSNEIIDFSKLCEGDNNRIFLLTFNDNFQMIARVPYPVTGPKYYALASEVATMEYLRLSGLPIPEVYGYSPEADNTAGTAYIFMEYIQGSSVREVWWRLGDEEIAGVGRQFAQLEAKMMALSFPAGGSLYFVKDLEKLGMQGIAVSLPANPRFCVGPDTRLSLWYKNRERMYVNRGPYHTVEDALVAGARKEIAYLKQLRRPIPLPTRRERWSDYRWKSQPPSDRVQNLERYLSITSALIPNDPDLHRFRLCHPDFRISNIILNSDRQIVGLIDWERTSILPLFLLARCLGISSSTASIQMSPQAPNPDGPDITVHHADVYRRQLMNNHYVKSTEVFNEQHYRAFSDPLHVFRVRLFEEASAPWKGETLDFKVLLIKAWRRWDELNNTRGGTTSPCPFHFDAEDQRSTLEFSSKINDIEQSFDVLQARAGVMDRAGWIPTEEYEDAKMILDTAREKAMRRNGLTERQMREFVGPWPWDDIDERMLAE
ncbi:kinase-like domain-containing protein [Coprinopsis sp. MPI-PUGE-AT-0042]|nr:kinase-like domain-containing protein [Coprinopsis sp. MPI-PUGE-AT-0042]